MVKRYKTFLATSKPVGGVIRVVLVRGWTAGWRSSRPTRSRAWQQSWRRWSTARLWNRSSIDLKAVHGAGQQQLRQVWANVGAWKLIGSRHTLVELWSWDRPHARLCDRSDSPWDKKERRSSPANRCQQLRREALQEEDSRLPSGTGLRPKIRRFIQSLMRAVA